MLNKNTSTIMNFKQAIDVINDIKEDPGAGLLDTLQYMDRNLFQFDETQRAAFRLVMNKMVNYWPQLIKE